MKYNYFFIGIIIKIIDCFLFNLQSYQVKKKYSSNNLKNNKTTVNLKIILRNQLTLLNEFNKLN